MPIEPLAPSGVSHTTVLQCGGTGQPWAGVMTFGLSGLEGTLTFLPLLERCSTAPNQFPQDRELSGMAGGQNLTSSCSPWSVLEEYTGCIAAHFHLTLPTAWRDWLHPPALCTALAMTALRHLLTKAAACKSTKEHNPDMVLAVYDSSDGGTAVEGEILKREKRACTATKSITYI